MKMPYKMAVCILVSGELSVKILTLGRKNAVCAHFFAERGIDVCVRERERERERER